MRVKVTLSHSLLNSVPIVQVAFWQPFIKRRRWWWWWLSSYRKSACLWV